MWREKPLYFVKNKVAVVVIIFMVLLLPTVALFDNVNPALYEIARVLNIIGVTMLILSRSNIVTLNMDSSEVQKIIKENAELKLEIDALKKAT